MSVFRCVQCERYIDSDFSGCAEYKDELICLDCEDKINEEKEENDPMEAPKGTVSTEFDNVTSILTVTTTTKEDEHIFKMKIGKEKPDDAAV